MTRIEMLKGITWITILKVMLSPEEIEKVENDVRAFFCYRTGLPIEARNAVLIRVIMLKRSDFNIAYLRKTQESFLAERLTSAPVIIAQFDRWHDNQRKLIKNHRSEPDWMDDYISDLKRMENQV
jgi:hypothetical protein